MRYQLLVDTTSIHRTYAVYDTDEYIRTYFTPVLQDIPIILAHMQNVKFMYSGVCSWSDTSNEQSLFDICIVCESNTIEDLLLQVPYLYI